MQMRKKRSLNIFVESKGDALLIIFFFKKESLVCIILLFMEYFLVIWHITNMNIYSYIRISAFIAENLLNHKFFDL